MTGSSNVLIASAFTDTCLVHVIARYTRFRFRFHYGLLSGHVWDWFQLVWYSARGVSPLDSNHVIPRVTGRVLTAAAFLVEGPALSYLCHVPLSCRGATGEERTGGNFPPPSHPAPGGGWRRGSSGFWFCECPSACSPVSGRILQLLAVLLSSVLGVSRCCR